MKKLNIYIFILGLLLFSNGFCLDMPEKLAENIPGKMVFGSERTDDGQTYIFLLEDGKITKLGIVGFAPRFSPDGRYVSSFDDDNNAVIYDLKKKKIKKTYSLKYRERFDHCWSNDGKYLIYGSEEVIGEKKDGGRIFNKYVMKLNLKTGKEEVLLKYENVGFSFYLAGFTFSPNKKEFLFTAGEITNHKDLTKTDTLYLYDLKNNRVIPLWKLAKPVGWYPDGKHILIHTNNDGKNERLKRINDQRGRLYKVNIDTMETEIIQETINDVYSIERLSRDGKFIYSDRYNYLHVFNIVLAEIGKRDEEMMVTYPVPYTFHGEDRYSSDSAPDWRYEDLKIKGKTINI